MNKLSDDILSSKFPIKLDGLVADWPLLTGKKTVIEQLIDDCSNQQIHAFVAEKEINGRYFYNPNLNGFNFTKVPLNILTVLTQFLTEKIEQSIYVGSANMEQFFPNLKQQNKLKLLDKYKPTTSIWLGNESRIAAHQDSPLNIACCIQGKRRFTLFPPEQISNLYIGPLDNTPAGQPISLVDFDQPDFIKHPKFKEALKHAYIFDLEPGDSLFIPSMWWHHVEGLDPFNVLINFWWKDIPSFMGDPMDSFFHTLLNIKELPQHEKKAWQALFEHYIFSNDTCYSHIPQESRGVLANIDDNKARYLRAMLLQKLNR
ncbi:MAG: cupin-like domain-containing protein [Thalassotalea sp.]|nr:cupin-like domain-containing protein [Thalassotalea sp.]